MDRRNFVASAAAGVLSFSAVSYGRVPGANDRLRVGMMGMGNRGSYLAPVFAKLENTEVAFLSDPDKDRLAKGGASLEKVTGKAPKLVPDFRTFLDDKSVDVMVCAAPNFWHAPGTILAVNAGKHVYVEKPCSHNGREGEWLVEVADKNKKLVQMGNHRRSFPHIQEAMEFLHSGGLGRVYLAQCWYQNNRLAMKKGIEEAPPKALDYELWQGPAPHRPYRTNYLHYTWHWFWTYGNGELGNNGIHMIDVCRWGLGVDYPSQVSSTGGRYRWEDEQETPDTNLVTINYPDRKTIVWEGLSCNRLPVGSTPDIIFQGEKGSLAITGSSYTIYDEKGKETKKIESKDPETGHMKNFVDSIREKAKLTSPILEGHKSTLACHLGNIAYRLGKVVKADPKTGRPVDSDAMALWGREYEKGWEPKV